MMLELTTAATPPFFLFLRDVVHSNLMHDRFLEPGVILVVVKVSPSLFKIVDVRFQMLFIWV